MFRHGEIKDYDWQKGWSRNGEKVGHFTQMVWKRTKRVGYAVVKKNNPKDPRMIFAMVIAKYHRGGNIIGQIKQNVGKLV